MVKDRFIVLYIYIVGKYKFPFKNQIKSRIYETGFIRNTFYKKLSGKKMIDTDRLRFKWVKKGPTSQSPQWGDVKKGRKSTTMNTLTYGN